MPCNCKNKTRYQVQTPDGKVVFTSSSSGTAAAVSRRYPGSTVVDTKAA